MEFVEQQKQLEGAGVLAEYPLLVFLMDKPIEDKRIAVIGAGDLGSAIIESLYDRRHRRITATRKSESRLREFSQRYSGITATKCNSQAAEDADVIIIGVKPKDVTAVASEISQYTGNKLVISIAAGVQIAELETEITSARIARVMTDLTVSDSVAAYSVSERCKDEDREAIRYIFGDSAIEADEYLLDARTAVACHEGILSMELETVRLQLVKEGFTDRQAAAIIAGKLRGIANLMEKGATGEEIFERVAGPGSYTLKMYEFLRERNYFRLLGEYFSKVIDALRR